jgi:hypothetical protein
MTLCGHLPHHAKGLCRPCYQRWWYVGSPMRDGLPRVPDPAPRLRGGALAGSLLHRARLEDFTWLREEIGLSIGKAGARVGVGEAGASRLEAERKRNSLTNHPVPGLSSGQQTF